MNFVEYIAIPAIIIAICLMIYIAATLKNIEMHVAYKNMMIEKIEEDSHKLYFAERIILKKEHGVDLEDLYGKYKKSFDSNEMNIILGQKAKKNPNFDY